MHIDYGYFEEAQLGKPYDLKLLKRLYPFVRPYRSLILLCVVLVMLITVLELAVPYLTKIGIDRYIVPQVKTAQSPGAEPSKAGTRELQVNLEDRESRDIVQRHEDLFRIEGSTASIAHDKLPALTEEELRRLRSADLTGLQWIALIFILLIVVDFALNFIQRLLMEYTGHIIMHDLRMGLFNHIQDLAIEFFTRNPVGRLVTRTTNDVQNMHELFTSLLTFVFKDLFMLIGIAAVMLALNWKLALVSFAVLPFVVYASMDFSRRARNVFRILRIKIAEINTRFSETIGGIRVLQLFSQEKNNYQQFRELNHENYLAGLRQIHILAIFMPLIELLGIVAVAIVIFYGGSQVLQGTLSLGALVAFITYIRMFFRPIRDLAEKYNILQNAMSSAERIFLIFDTSNTVPQVNGITAARKPARFRIDEIRFEHVDFSYIAGEHILKDISFQIRGGETVGIVGPTGAGKTSLINLLTRFYDPSRGRIRVNGIDLKEFDLQTLRSKIALVTQDPFLFSDTIRENILQGHPDLSPQRLQHIIEASNCQSLINRVPQGIDTVLSEGGASLSSGERQLISIARAFARNPELILFDEATSYVDSQTELNLQQALEKLMQGRTAIIVAHRLSTVREAHLILVMNRGRIIETGTHAQLMQQQGFYYRLHQLQN
jgi:ATP-binding cassette subfamily B protein